MGTGSAKGPNDRVPIVGIGASAGGLTPLREFIRAIPPHSGLAYVVIQHLAPDSKSHLADVLSEDGGKTVTIEEVSDGVRPEADHVYVVPVEHDIELEHGQFRLVARDPSPARHLPVDRFFRSLAAELKECAIGVILSGSGSDGTLGAAAIKENGGVVLAQDPAEAEFGAMSESALRRHLVDSVHPAREIPQIIVDFIQHPSTPLHSGRCQNPGSEPSPQLTTIIDLLHTRTGFDFVHYKKTGLSRRIHRRMGLLGIESLSDYRRYLADTPSEPMALVNDLLIGATGFFRDREAWDVFYRAAVEPMVEAKDNGEAIRIWVPACATGEEAYTVTAMVHEALRQAGKSGEVQVYATDINETALLKAREGVYPFAAVADIPKSYLDRYFHPEPEANRLRVDAKLREDVVFARQNLLGDPPFSRLDLLLCRNLLIYLDPGIQSRVIDLFHFALGSGGVLFLGSAESIGDHLDLYEPIDKKWRIYRRVGTRKAGSVDIPLNQSPATLAALKATALAPARAESELEKFTNRLLIERFCPAAVLVNAQFDVLYFAGPTHGFLEHPTGLPTRNLLDLARTELRGPLRKLIYRAIESGRIAATKATLLSQGRARVAMRAEPVAPGGEGEKKVFLVTFESVNPPAVLPEKAERLPEDAGDEVVQQLEYELSVTRQDLQDHIEQLKSVNEELQSANEELQISNEELETSREELQSVNEELTTVNAQLQAKIDELEETNDALRNFLASSQVPTLFLDRRLHIRRFTPAITALLPLRAADLGRPFSDFSTDALGPHLSTDIDHVLEKAAPVEREVEVRQERWYIRRVLPYRTGNHGIDGVVVTFTDISHLKESEASLLNAQATLERRVRDRTLELAEANRKLEHGRERLEQEVKRRTEELNEARQLAEKRAAEAAETAARDDAVLMSMSDGLVLADPDGNILEMNPVALSQHEFSDLEEAKRHFQFYTEAFELLDLEGHPIPLDQWPLPRALRREKYTNYVVQVHRFKTGRRWYANYSGTPVYDANGTLILAVLTIRDVTELREAENALRSSEQRFRSAVDNYPSPFVIYDAERRLQFINPVGREWLGLNEEEVLGRTDEEILPESVTGAYLPALLRAISQRSRETIETDITWNGSNRSLTISYIPLLNSRGEIEQILGITQDLSDTVRAKRSVEKLNADLRRRAAELQIANRELESFAYSVSHDLRAPLRAISSFSAILQDDYAGKLDAQADDYLTRISESAIRMAKLIDDLLNLSRITRHQLSFEVVDLSSLTHALVGELQSNGQCSDDTEWDIEEGLTVLADRGLLRVALQNLLRNACKFTARSAPPRITLGATELEEQQVFYIRDNGVGFDMAYSGNLFKPFQRLHDPSDFEGTGIGLAIVQRIIARHGGRIWAESEPNQGATFYFTL